MLFKKSLLILFIFLNSVCYSQEILTENIKQHITYLASDALEGRAPGTKGEKLAYEYIIKEFGLYGIAPKGEKGYLQTFSYKRNIHPHGGKGSGKKIKASNVIGFLNNNADNTIVIGAHYDHLGNTDHHSSLSKNTKGEIHNGADDNASGVAGILELAKYFSTNAIKENSNFLFIAFSAEEDGLIGSKYFTQNATIDLSKVTCMINMDMVGRLNDSTKNLLVYGIGTSSDYGKIFSTINTPFNLIHDSSGVGPSDHTSFYLKKIPVLHFFTGQHTDYHKPSDDAEKINYNGTKEVINYIKNIAETIAQQPKLAFTETKSKTQEAVSFKVTLGIMPDYAFQDKGVKIDAVTNGKPAQVAGIKAGDIITAIANEPTKDVYEYMKQLAKFSKGDETNVTIQRDKNTLNFKVKF
jgi:hypothetical protein